MQLESFAMFSTSCQSSSMFSTCRFRRPAGSLAKSHSFATLRANLERPPAMRQPALLMHSCIFPLSQVFRHQIGRAFTPRHFRDGKLSAGHRLLRPQDMSMEVSLLPPRREAIDFDAVASTRTHGLITVAMSAAMAAAPRALEALLVKP